MESVHKGLGVLSVAIASTVVAINLLGTNANSQSIVTDGEVKIKKNEAIVKSVEAKTTPTEVSETGIVAEQTGGGSVNEDVKKAPPGLYFVPSFPSVEKEFSTKEKKVPQEEPPQEESPQEESPKEESPKETAPEAPKETASEAQKKFISLEQQKNTVFVVMDDNGEPQVIFPDMPDEGESLEWANVAAQKESLEKQEPSRNIVPSMPPQWMQKEPTGVPQAVGSMKSTQQPGAQYYQSTNQMPHGVNGMPYYQYMSRVMYVPVYQYRRADAVNQAPKVQASSRTDAIAPQQNHLNKSSE